MPDSLANQYHRLWVYYVLDARKLPREGYNQSPRKPKGVNRFTPLAVGLFGAGC